MSAPPSSSPSSSPWPRPTQPPSPAPFHYPDSLQRRRVFERQVITDLSAVATAQERCNIYSGNEVYSCFPTTVTVIPQGEWASFVCTLHVQSPLAADLLSETGNSRRPEITQTNLVDIFLFRADSQTQILHFRNVSNPTDQAGLIRAQVNDSWFGSDGLLWSRGNVSYPFYWVIIRNDKTLDGNQVPQPIFTAVQTTMLDSVASSSSAAASSRSLQASLSSARSQSLASQSSSLATGDGHVQHSLSDSQFPRWAIAVIVVLGFLAITATCLLTFLILRRLRRQRTEASMSRNSMNSNSPMILNHDAQMKERHDSPLLPPTGALSSVAGAHTFHDGASTDSGGPFSGADAAIMAQAFRTTLRQPDFVGRPVEEGESPDQNDAQAEEDDIGGAGSSRHHGSLALSKELTEEGRDIRSVSSSRGVKVESLPAGASTEESR